MRGKTHEDFRLLELVDPVAEAEGYDIVRLRLMAGDRARRLQILAERTDGAMPVEACAALARSISRVLDDADPISGGYLLEVSSPGVDRPLTRNRDFTDFAGCEAKIEIEPALGGRKRFRGVIGGIDGADILILAEAGAEAVRLPLAAVVEAKLILNDALLKRGADARARRLAAQDNPLDHKDTTA